MMFKKYRLIMLVMLVCYYILPSYLINSTYINLATNKIINNTNINNADH